MGGGWSFDPKVYIDSVGVPNKFKARNQVADGFKSALFWWSTINKNVDWINYIFYNQQRFINYTRDDTKETAEQLRPTSQMAWENRLDLDMMLAEKGGVCVMIGAVLSFPITPPQMAPSLRPYMD